MNVREGGACLKSKGEECTPATDECFQSHAWCKYVSCRATCHCAPGVPCLFLLTATACHLL
jgi:hypothetical protein